MSLVYQIALILLSSSMIIASAAGLNLKPEKAKEIMLPVGVEGLVLCKSGSTYVPIQGATARISCLAENEKGYETNLPSTRCETDTKGYFFSMLDNALLEKGFKLTECKAFLENSPSDNCQIPTDVNKGITGALLSSHHILTHKNIKIFSVGPFFYINEPSSSPDGY